MTDSPMTDPHARPGSAVLRAYRPVMTASQTAPHSSSSLADADERELTPAEQRLKERNFPKTLDDPRVPVGQPLGLRLSGDPLLDELVHHVISSAVMDPVDRRGSQVVRSFGHMLQLYATVPEDDAPFPELATVALTSASVARKLLDITFDDERDAWVLERTEAADARVLPIVMVEPLCAYAPAPLWRVVERIIRDGREVFVKRMTAALCKESTRALKQPNRKRRDGGNGSVSPASVGNPRRRAAYLGTMLFELSANGRFADRLTEGGWNVRPVTAGDLGDTEKRAVTRGASETQLSVTDTAAPALRLVRLAFAGFDTQVKQDIDWEPGDDEVKLINALPEKKVTSKLEGLLRDRLLVLWLPRFAPRAGAFPYLSEACVQCKHQFLDGEIGPGVLVFDPKTRTSAVWRWRPFEDELIPLIKAYLAIKRRRPAHIITKTWKTVPADVDTMDLLQVPDSAQELLRAGKHKYSVVEQSPALFRSPLSLRALTPDALNSLCGGGYGRRPLVPRPDDPRYGFNPHALARHLHRGLVSSDAALRYCERHGLDPAHRDIWGEMDMDHELAGLDHLYKDDNSNLGRERGTRQGGRVVCEQLTTDVGLRTHRDDETYVKALQARDTTEEELRRIEDDFERQAERIERDGTDVPVKTVVRLLRLGAQSTRFARDLTEINSTIIGIEAGHDDFLVTVADHIPSNEVPRVDLAKIKREHRKGVPQGRVRALREDHIWYTAEDLVEIGVGKSATVRGWMKNAVEGKPVPPKAPWDPSDNPVFYFPGDRRRRALYAPAAGFATQEQRDMGAAILARERREGWEHLPKMVPDPRPSASQRRLRAA